MSIACDADTHLCLPTHEQVPSPRWARQLDKVDKEGLRFMRGGEGSGEASSEEKS